MSEKSAVRDLAIKVGICLAFATCYMLGGWGEFLDGAKWLRRFVAPLILAGGLFYFSRDWKYLLTAPLVGLGASLGYGADLEWLKVFKRFYCGVVLGLGSSIGFFLNRKRAFCFAQTIILSVLSVYLGVYNPLSDARAEEFAIGFMIAFLPMMAVRRKIN